jgi:hypothetical protein
MIIFFFCSDEVSGDVSGEIGFAAIEQLFCYDISGEVSGEISDKFCG